MTDNMTKLLDAYAKTIEEQKRENERLRAALRLIERTASQYSGTTWVRVEDIAKEALGEDE